MENKSLSIMNGSKTTTRLMITKMILENFKSYAGIQEIGPFHKRFSSIVGPNGSGKSNVIDALLFVFAKRASQLRLKKVSELIHKSSGFPNLEYAQVSVYFQLIQDDESSEDDYEVVAGSEFIISRVAYRNNESKYMINTKSSKPSEVKDLLHSYDIDLDNNRFLILQGEVEQIAMMKPKANTPQEEGLLEYLEDIIGSNRFVEKIEEISKQLDTMNEQRLEHVNRLKLSERDRDNLSGSKAEAENYMEKEKEIRRKQNILYQAFGNIAEKNFNDSQERQDKLNEKLSKEKLKRSENESLLNETELEYKRTNKDYDEVSSELQKTSTEFSAFERRDIKLQEDMKFNEAQLKKTQANLMKESKKESEGLTEANRAASTLGTIRRSIEDITAKKIEEETKIEEIMSSLQEATKPLRERVEIAQVNLAEAERHISGFQSEKEVVNTRIQILKSRADGATTVLNTTQTKLQHLKEEKGTCNVRIQDLEMEGKDLEKNLQLAEKQRKVLSEREILLQSTIRQSRGDIEDAKSRLTAQKNGGSNNSVVLTIMKAASSRGPLATAGVHGRLGDLAMIDTEFDIAISTACGVLDNIVVETTEGAQLCLNYLKENNLGRATFILLDQMNEWKTRMTTPFRVPSGTQRLFDLIHCSKEIYLPAFYMALKDTLVANDLDSATAIAYIGDRAVHRVVTRTGDLIDTSGAMSGGGKEVKSGAMKLKSTGIVSVSSTSNNSNTNDNQDEMTAEIIQSMEIKLEELQGSLQTCRTEMEQNEQRFKEIKNRIKTRVVDLNKEMTALSGYVDQENELNNRLQSIISETQLTVEEKQEIISLEKHIQELDHQMTLASPNLKIYKLEVSNLQQQIRDVGGPKLGKAQARLDLLSGQLDKMTKELSSLEVEETNSRKQAVKAQASKEKYEKEMLKFEMKLKELVQEQHEMEQDALLVAEAVEAAKVKMIEKENDLKMITAKYNQIKTMVEKIRGVEVDIQSEIDKNIKEIQSHQDTMNGWHHKLELIRKEHVTEQLEFKATVDSAIIKITSVSGVAATIKEDVMKELETLPNLAPELLERAIDDIDQLKKEINILEAEREKMRGSINMNALLEYLKKDVQYRVRVAELEVITEQRNSIRKEYEDLRRQRLEEFMSGFGVISLKLKEMYQMITLGGDAELELVDSLDPFSEGIVFTVRPKNKSWKNISNLSGGEKTLSSLALVFALHHYKPTPLYVMDEIDAALDFKNVSIVANYIKDRTKNAQFVIISLRNNMFELADRLVGIYKTHDATKSVTINPKLISAEAMRIDEVVEENNQESSSIDTSSTTTMISKVAVKPIVRRVLADSTNTKA